MRRFWVSWWSGNYADEGCTKPPFVFMVSGSHDRNDDTGRDECSCCAVFDARNGSTIRRLVTKHFPDARFRFVKPEHHDFEPGDRFPDCVPFRVIE